MLEEIRKAPEGAVFAVAAVIACVLASLGHWFQGFLFSPVPTNIIESTLGGTSGIAQLALHFAWISIALFLGGGLTIWLLVLRSIPYRATRLIRKLRFGEQKKESCYLRWAWKKGYVWHLTWKVPYMMVASVLEKNKEVFEQTLDANCHIWAEGGLVRMRAGTAKIPKFLSYEDFYENNQPPKGQLMWGVGWSREGALWQDLAEAPHMLCGGTPGAGKTVFLRQGIVNLLLRYKPEELKLVPIDLKRVEFNVFRNVPHLLPGIGVVLDMDKLEQALGELSNELFRRLSLLEAAGVASIQDWNLKYPEQKLPLVLAVFDELAEVQRSAEANGNQRASKALLALLARICCLGRAAGIHVIACTQRPDAEMVPSQIKAQLPVTVAFRCRGENNSKILLEDESAAVLPPDPGIGIWQWNRSVKFRSPYLSKDDAQKLLDAAYPIRPAVVKPEPVTSEEAA